MKQLVLVTIALTLLVSISLHCANGAPEEYEVKSLPGWDGDLPSKWYSGFTDAGIAPNGKGGMHMHWVYVESENSPEKDPLIVWYNGGPGASSMFGLLVELGPLELNDLSTQNWDSKDPPKLIRNNYAWTKFANLLVVENPPPVGFSYCEPAGVTGDGYSCGAWNDSAVATANHIFLKNWFKQFPELMSNDLYIAGESYAGVYVPVIVRSIMKDPFFKNLKGFAVGDGCMGSDVYCSILTKSGNYTGPFWFIEFMYGHGQVENTLYREIQAKCTVAELRHGKMSAVCKALVDKLQTDLGGYFTYAVYDECSGNIFAEEPTEEDNSRINKRYEPPYPPFPGPGYPCSGPALSLWIKRSDVRQALHVPDNGNWFNSDDGDDFTYEMTEQDLRPFYADVVKNSDLRVLAYVGDTDPSINSFVLQDIYFEYFEQVGIKTKDPWRAWTLDGKTWMGGYVKEYEGNFNFLTIRGSGHMVPEFKPVAAQSMMSAFILNEGYLPYKPTNPIPHQW